MDEITLITQKGPQMAVELASAVVAGGMIGLEREVRGRAAGLKTCTLICVGATLYMQASVLLTQGTTLPADPTRVAGQIVTGIGFLGAGAVIRSEGHVVGLTTAATVWFLGAVGIVIGSHFPATGLILALVVSGVLVVERWAKRRLFPDQPDD